MSSYLILRYGNKNFLVRYFYPFFLSLSVCYSNEQKFCVFVSLNNLTTFMALVNNDCNRSDFATRSENSGSTPVSFVANDTFWHFFADSIIDKSSEKNSDRTHSRLISFLLALVYYLYKLLMSFKRWNSVAWALGCRLFCIFPKNSFHSVGNYAGLIIVY